MKKVIIGLLLVVIGLIGILQGIMLIFYVHTAVQNISRNIVPGIVRNIRKKVIGFFEFI